MSAQASEKLDRASPSPIESHPVTAHQARRREVLVGLTVLVAGLLLLVAALQIAEPARQSPGFGPRVLPLAVSSGLVICGALLVWGALRGRDPRAGLGDDLLGEEDGDRVEEVLDWDEPPVPWTGLAVVVGEDELTGGDFVRTMKQLVDLTRQVAVVAPDAQTRERAREAAGLAFRGVVADSVVSGDE